MFAVLGYQLENEDVLAALKTVSKHLKKGGVFICDVWYGPAVLNQKPGERVRVIEKGDTKIIRVSSGTLDSFRNIVEVHYHLWEINKMKVIEETQEKHSMRFFFPQELQLLFKLASIELLTIYAFPISNGKVDERTWNIGVVGLAT
jgi:hypothetical protein